MVGDKIPNNNEVWSLYIMLREIIHITTSPNVTKSHLLQLETLVTDHHTLYIKLFGDLKPKFHFLIHYSNLMLKIGPIIKLSSMRFESKHRNIKSILQGSSSHVNIYKSIGIRYQLSQMYLYNSAYKEMYITHGAVIENNSVNAYFPTSKNKLTLSSVTINDVV